ncbi:hypothetical protein ACQEU3_44780 [Spirillospora sp. CA-253888]
MYALPPTGAAGWRPPPATCAGPREFLHYRHALEQGRLIATKAVEGTARHLLGDRLDITGARWGLTGAEAILKLRAVISNGDLEAYWTFHTDRERHRLRQARHQDKFEKVEGGHS